MYKCTIVNGWHDDNKGDCAIVLCTMRMLEQRLQSTSFNIVSGYSLNKTELPRAYRHIISEYPLTETAISLLPKFEHKGGVINPYLIAATYIIRSIYMTITKDSFGEGNRLINESDVVISKGGHMLHCVKKRNVIHWLNLYNHLYPLILARKAGVPYVFWGHSFGPFNDTLAYKFAAKIFLGAEIVGVRETISHDIACQMGIPRKKIRLMPDPAFGILPKNSQKVEDILIKNLLETGNFLAITVRSWGNKIDGSYDRYIEAIATIVNRLYHAGFCKKICIFVHVSGPTVRENDSLASHDLYKKLAGLPVSLVDDDLSPEEAVAFYEKAKFLIGTRFHSVIFSLVAGTPVYALSYFGPKALGIMKDIKMEAFVTDLSILNPDNIVKEILSIDIDKMRYAILSAVRTLREKLYIEADYLAKIVNGSLT